MRIDYDQAAGTVKFTLASDEVQDEVAILNTFVSANVTAEWNADAQITSMTVEGITSLQIVSYANGDLSTAHMKELP